jgi:hypothetical protein
MIIHKHISTILNTVSNKNFFITYENVIYTRLVVWAGPYYNTHKTETFAYIKRRTMSNKTNLHPLLS